VTRVVRAQVTRVEGTRPIIEAIRAGRRRVHEVRLPRKARTPAQRELESLVAERGIAWEHAEEGPIASADPFPEEPYEQLLTGPGPPFLVALDRVTDVGNLGSIARSAEIAGAGGLVLELRHAPPIGPGALRARAGALEHLRIGRAPNLGRALDLARGEGFAILAAAPGGEPIESLPRELLAGPLIWVFGSEDRGLRKSISERADSAVGIVQHGRVASLGVAAAAAYLLNRTAESRGNSTSGGED
jgi:23S rRNA (guanosine2251-2'-O)-methyltransferase